MKMYEVFNFVMAIPQEDRPKNLAQILETISNKLRDEIHSRDENQFGDNSSSFPRPFYFFYVRGTNGSVYANCGGRLLCVDSDNIIWGELPESDTELWFEIYAEQLRDISLKVHGPIQFNLLCQQLLELNEDRALPIIEAKLKEIAGKVHQIHVVKSWKVATEKKHHSSENASYRIVIRPSIKTLNHPETKIEIVTGICPELFDEEKHTSHETLVKPTEKYCLEFLLNALL